MSTGTKLTNGEYLDMVQRAKAMKIVLTRSGRGDRKLAIYTFRWRGPTQRLEGRQLALAWLESMETA